MFLALTINLKKNPGDCSKTEKFTSLLSQKKNINVSVVSTVIKMLMLMYVYTQIMEIKFLLTSTNLTAQTTTMSLKEKSNQ